jgi:putative PIN family toxin of toxin-antitoxin system
VVTRPLRAVLDTNILVSGHLWAGGAPGRVLRLGLSGHFEIVVNPAIIEEIGSLSGRRKFARYSDALRELVGAVSAIARVETDRRDPPVLPRDSNDIHLLSTLLASGADCLVTGDADLLVLSGVYPIDDASRFLERLNAHR